MLTFVRKWIRQNYTANPGRIWQLTTLFLSFLLAVSLWVLVTLNQPNQVSLNFSIGVNQIPTDVQVSDLNPGQLVVLAKGNGLDLVMASIRTKRDTLYVPYQAAFAEKGMVAVNQFENLIRDHVKSPVEILDITPATVAAHIEFKVSKRVPLVFNSTLNLPPAYRLTQAVSLSQDSVTVLGPQAMLDTVEAWFTAPVKTETITTAQEISIPVLDTSSQLIVTPKSVQAIVTPRKYTETTLTYFIKITDLPIGKSVRLSSNQLTVACLVPMDSYEMLLSQITQDTLYIPFDKLTPSFPYIVPEVDLPNSVRPVYRDPFEISYVIVHRAPEFNHHTP